MTADERVTKLRSDLGLKPGQLLRNSSGSLADILSVDEHGYVVLGILGGGTVRIHRSQLYATEPNEIR